MSELFPQKIGTRPSVRVQQKMQGWEKESIWVFSWNKIKIRAAYNQYFDDSFPDDFLNTGHYIVLSVFYNQLQCLDDFFPRQPF